MKNILSIDGGGIRGIIPLACLIELEKVEGRPSREIFDMVAGTSTGAVIAAGIAIGISARGLMAIYRNLAESAFQALPFWKVALNLGNHWNGQNQRRGRHMERGRPICLGGAAP